MIINLTQHSATPEQKKVGVVDLNNPEVVENLTFEKIPHHWDLVQAAYNLAAIALEVADDAVFRSWQELGEHVDALRMSDIKVMVGGAPYLMPYLEDELRKVGLTPVYAFSRRESVEEHMPDGSVVKRNVFRHAGFVKPGEEG